MVSAVGIAQDGTIKHCHAFWGDRRGSDSGGGGGVVMRITSESPLPLLGRVRNVTSPNNTALPPEHLVSLPHYLATSLRHNLLTS